MLIPFIKALLAPFPRINIDFGEANISLLMDWCDLGKVTFLRQK